MNDLSKLTIRQLPLGMGKAAAWVMVLAVTLSGLVLWVLNPLLMQNLRLAQFDQFQRWSPRAYTPAAVRVVDIDEASLRAVGQWPWPRDRLAELVERLHQAGVAALAFDVLLTEPDHTAPAAMARLWRDPTISAALRHLPDPDAELANSLVGRPVVLGSHLSRSDAAPTSAAPLAIPLATPITTPPGLPYRMVTSGRDPSITRVPGFDAALWPLPLLLAHAQGVGALNAAPDPDGVVRRVPLVLRRGTELVPSLDAEALRVAQGGRNYLVRTDAQGVVAVRIGSVEVPTNAQGEMWLHYTAPQPQRLVSAHQVLSGEVPSEMLRGHIVLIGSSAAGLMDLRANPMGQAMPGVLAHAQALEQLVVGYHLQRPAWTLGLEALVLVIGALVVGWVALLAPARWAALVLLVALTVLGAGAWFAFVSERLLLDASNPALALLLVFGLASGWHHWSAERQQRWLRTAFSRYVSPNRVDHLVAHPEQLHLGGRRQMCSFVFTDLVGFTPMLEAHDPERMVALLNDYLEAMLVIVFKHEGTLDRFVGDAMVVLFSAPVAQADHQQRALDCALALDVFAIGYAGRLQAQGIPWGLTRIGVHCGEVMVGNFGGKTLFDYRALGDPINTAARLESANKHLGTRVCVSQDLLDGCTGVPVRAIGRVLLKGKSKALSVVTPCATLDPRVCAPAADYGAAMAQLQAGPTQDVRGARAAFNDLALRYPNDPLVALHHQRLCEGGVDDLIVMADK